MLKQLTIENYTLIKQLEIDFNSGFSVITGETGAGKSILLGALSLILGQRADTDVLHNKDKKCVIEGKFNIERLHLKSWFDDRDLDYDDDIYLRREINKSGKSRAFINDTPATLPVMKELGNKLVNIHSQHNTLTLNKENFQKAIVNDYAQLDNELESYKVEFKEYQKNKSKLQELIEADEKSRADLDYYEFQYKELEEANLIAGEQDELEKEQELLENTESIKSVFYNASHILNHSEQDVLSSVKEIINDLNKLGSVLDISGELAERLESLHIELSDISDEMESQHEKLSYDPERLQQISDRLNMIWSLQQKHRIKTVEELISLRDDLDAKIAGIGNLEHEIVELKSVLEEIELSLWKKAHSISEKRKEASTKIESDLIEVLSEMGMKDSVFKVNFRDSEKLLPDGKDTIQFLFNANKGGTLGDISQVASGGELSRLMLGIKSLVFTDSLLPTIIFDEIDTGVSGDIAGKVGNIMKKMSSKMQVIAITHLPQIAGKSNSHYFVYKSSDSEKTTSNIKQLSKSERIEEIAKMMSNDSITDAAILAAKELIN
jgi:DNA repair protein RecN (Recombination protein N)